MARLNDPIIETSINLQQLPFDFDVKRRRNRGGVDVAVTLYPIVGQPVTGNAATFAIAYTVALNKMKQVQLVNREPDIDELIDEMPDHLDDIANSYDEAWY